MTKTLVFVLPVVARIIFWLCWSAVFQRKVEENPVADVVFTVLAIGFFVLAIAYVHGCERLK